MSDPSPRPDQALAARRELFAVLAHELRSPIGAILGFEELLSEGILGDMPPRSADALARIRGSARQLLELVAGLNDLAFDAGDVSEPDVAPVDGAHLVRSTIATLRHEAEGRATTVVDALPASLPHVHTDPERAARAFQLALMAAIKSTAGGTIRVEARVDAGALVASISSTRIDPEGDDPDRTLADSATFHLTGAGLRISMARRALAVLGGSLDLASDPSGTTLTLRLPDRPDR